MAAQMRPPLGPQTGQATTSHGWQSSEQALAPSAQSRARRGWNRWPSHHVINDRCIKDMRCIAACMRKAIHPTPNDLEYASAGQLHINPLRCIGCGSCAEACLNGAIFELADLPAAFQPFAEINAAWYRA